MQTSNHYHLAIQALQELIPVLENTNGFKRMDAVSSSQTEELPTLFEIIKNLDPIPKSSIFLGMATDGLPVLLNLNDPQPGPILVIGDHESGKNFFLQTIAQAISILHAPKNVRFGVITYRPEIWREFQRKANCLGVFTTNTYATIDFLEKLTNWTHSNHNDTQSILLLIDEIENSIPDNRDAQQDLFYLLNNGPVFRVWPFATLNTTQYSYIGNWTDLFKTRIYGQISGLSTSSLLGIPAEAGLNTLKNGNQFTLPESNSWLRFWIPTMEK
ncbi:MAG: hypothetical protein JXA13_13110 [Anaerolineales bacterium]|nr:hypothetical protein [Anaerolineales bacterium]